MVVSPSTITFSQNFLMYTVGKGLGMTLLALMLYVRVRVVSTLFFARIACAYMVECAYARTYICACTSIRVSLRMFTHINANAVSYVRLRVWLRTGLIKMQNTFVHKVFQHSHTHFGFRNLQDVL